MGLNNSIARNIFTKYINDNTLNEKQKQFIEFLIEYVTKNGTIEMQKLTKQPFNTLGEVYDLFEDNIDLFNKIKKDIEMINDNAEKLV